MSIIKKKISEFPAATTLKGFRVLGVNDHGDSAQADLGFIELAANSAKDATASTIKAIERAENATDKANAAAQSITDPLSILAHSDCTLEERIAQLEQLLLEALSGKMYIPALKVRDFEAWGDVNLVLTGAGAPTRSPDKVGQFYVDTLNRVLYFATGNNAVLDWK